MPNSMRTAVALFVFLSCASTLRAQGEFIYLKATPASGGFQQWGPGAKPVYFTSIVMACDQPETALTQAQQQFHPGLHHEYQGEVFLVSWSFDRSDCFATQQDAEQARKAEYDKAKRDGHWSPVWWSFRFTRND